MIQYTNFKVVYIITISERQIQRDVMRYFYVFHTIPTKRLRTFTRRCTVATGCATFHVCVLISVAVAVTSEFSASSAIFVPSCDENTYRLSIGLIDTRVVIGFNRISGCH